MLTRSVVCHVGLGYIGIMSVDKSLIAARDDDPVRLLVAVDPVLADHHHRDRAGGQRARSARRPTAAGDGPAMSVRRISSRNSSWTRRITSFLSGVRTVSRNGGPLVVDEQLDREAAPPGGERQAVRAAAAVARGHEDGGRFAPQAELEPPVEAEPPVERLHRHHQRRRAAGELQRLAVVRDARGRSGCRRGTRACCMRSASLSSS